MKFKFYKRR